MFSNFSIFFFLFFIKSSRRAFLYIYIYSRYNVIWQIHEETMTNVIFLGSTGTADGDCSHEIKRCLLLGRKAMTNLKWKSLSRVWLFVTPWTVRGMLQARILEWVSFPFSRGIFPSQRSNPGLLHCRQILYQLSQREAHDQPRQNIKRHYFANKGSYSQSYAFSSRHVDMSVGP